MSHRLHPTGDDPKDAILFDHCEDCTWHAELHDLDDDNCARAVDLMAGGRPTLTMAETTMVAWLRRAHDVLQRGGFLEPHKLVAQPDNDAVES